MKTEEEERGVIAEKVILSPQSSVRGAMRSCLELLWLIYHGAEQLLVSVTLSLSLSLSDCHCLSFPLCLLLCAHHCLLSLSLSDTSPHLQIEHLRKGGVFSMCGCIFACEFARFWLQDSHLL